jgi:serralysin
MALIIGTAGDDIQIVDLVNRPDTIYGDQLGALVGVGGDDRIFGRDFDDTLIGDADAVAAGTRGGNDLIVGGKGSDLAFGDALADLFGTGGDDFLRAGLAADGRQELWGDARQLFPGSRGGNDRLEDGEFMTGDGGDLDGAAGGDDVLDASGLPASVPSFLHGDAAGDMSGSSTGGDDLLMGGSADDRLYGDASGSLSSGSRGGNDRVAGNDGDDFVLGDASELEGTAVGGDDVVRGKPGDDEVYGDAVNLRDSAQGGDDRVHGGDGDDRLWGDGNLFGDAVGGNDVFTFGGAMGDDTIFDFRQGEDQIAFRALLPIDITTSVSGGNSVLSTSGGDSVTVVGYAGPFTVGTDIIFLA